MIVYKYHLETALNTVVLPRGAQALHVDWQIVSDIELWVAVFDKDAPKEARRFLVTGTGNDWDYPANNLLFINTFFSQNHDFVFHAFEVVE